MSQEVILIEYLENEYSEGEMNPETGMNYLQLIPTEVGLIQKTPAVEINNLGYRFVRAQLHEYHPSVYEHGVDPSSPTFIPKTFVLITKLSKEFDSSKIVSRYLIDELISNTVEPKPLFLSGGGYNPAESGKSRILLEHEFVGKYMLELVGPSFIDYTGDKAVIPSGAINRSDWEMLWIITFFYQFIVPFLLDSEIKDDFDKIFLAVNLIKDSVELIFKDPSIESASKLSKDVLDVLNNLIDRIASNETKRFWGRLKGRLKIVVHLIDLELFAVNLADVNAIDRYLIYVPSRYSVAIKPIPDFLELAVTERISLNLELAWQETSLSNMQEISHFHFATSSTHFFAMGEFKEDGIWQNDSFIQVRKLSLTNIFIQDPTDPSRLIPQYIEIIIACLNTGPSRVFHAELWDPEIIDGRVQLEFTNGLGEFIIGDRVGTANIIIEVINHSPLFRYGEDECKSQISIDVEVNYADILVSGPSLTDPVVKVGQRIGADLRVTMPDDLCFDINEPFWGNLNEHPEFPGFTISDIWVNTTHRWTNEEIVEKLPIKIHVYELGGGDDGRSLNFMLPEPDEISSGETYYRSLGAFIEGRQYGTRDLTVRVEPLDEIAEGSELAACEVQVKGVQLTLIMNSEDGPSPNELTLEDRLEYSNQGERNLVGTAKYQVFAEEDLLYSSDEIALLEGECQPNQLLFEKIWTEDNNGCLHLQPFELILDIDAPEVACFTLEHVTESDTEGPFRYWGTLEDLIKAIAPGSSSLQARIELPPNQHDRNHVFDISDVTSRDELPIYVPPPLDPLLLAWSKDAGSGFSDEIGNFSLESVSSVNVIYETGELRGQVLNHRPESTSERIRLYTPWSVQLDYVADGRNSNFEIDEDGYFVIETSNGNCLRLGSNYFDLYVWKPIHEVLGQINRHCVHDEFDGSNYACQKLINIKGVSPNVAISWGADGGEGFMNPQDPLSITYEYCRGSVNLENYAPGNSLFNVSQYSGAYAKTDKQIGIVHLKQGTEEEPTFGVHNIKLVAENDFGGKATNVTFIALEPEIGGINIHGDLPTRVNNGEITIAHNTDRYNRFVINIVLENITEYRVELHGAEIQRQNGINGSHALEIDLSENLNDFVVGRNNLLEIFASNYFGTVSEQLWINRRSNRWEILNSHVEIDFARPWYHGAYRRIQVKHRYPHKENGYIETPFEISETLPFICNNWPGREGDEFTREALTSDIGLYWIIEFYVEAEEYGDEGEWVSSIPDYAEDEDAYTTLLCCVNLQGPDLELVAMIPNFPAQYLVPPPPDGEDKAVTFATINHEAKWIPLAWILGSC